MSRFERPSRSDSASELATAREAVTFEDDQEGSIQFGCPMLSRTRAQGRHRGAIAPMRCSLGFALHGREEVGRCMAVESPSGCWKSAPTWRVELPVDEGQAADEQSDAEAPAEPRETDATEQDAVIAEAPAGGTRKSRRRRPVENQPAAAVSAVTESD